MVGLTNDGSHNAEHSGGAADAGSPAAAGSAAAPAAPAPAATATSAVQSMVYILVDGENIDMTLGQMILQARPRPDQRPRWERVARYIGQRFGKNVRPLFFLNASRGMPISFIAALQAMGYVPVPLLGEADQSVVDVAILRTLEALRDRPGDVVLASHDHDFAHALGAVAGPSRSVAVLGFEEFISSELRDLPHVEVIDLEHDADAFDGGPLPRVRVIPIDEFDPLRFL